MKNEFLLNDVFVVSFLLTTITETIKYLKHKIFLSFLFFFVFQILICGHQQKNWKIEWRRYRRCDNDVFNTTNDVFLVFFFFLLVEYFIAQIITAYFMTFKGIFLLFVVVIFAVPRMILCLYKRPNAIWTSTSVVRQKFHWIVCCLT